MADHMQQTAAVWFKAREIIVAFLREVCPGMTQAQHEHNAAAVIARLASAEPPLLICTADEMKEQTDG